MSIIMNFGKLYTMLRSMRISLAHAQRVTMSSGSIPMEYEKDPQPLFTDPETQHLLQSMTQLQLSKVYRKQTVPDNSIEYKFMTTEQLEDEFRRTIEKAHSRLQMPPVVQIKGAKRQIISKDSALKGFSDTKFVITDITYGLRQSERKVLVRDTDGTLEYAPLEVSKRVNQLYFPLKGRSLQVPRMFEEEHLERCLNEHKYEFVLDRMVVQFEPYELEFHRISSKVYQHINETKQFDALRSTRHFGPMAFFYAWHRCIDDLLYDMIRRDYLRNGTELIALMYKIHSIKVDYKTLKTQLDEILPALDSAMEELRKTLGSNSTDDIHEEIKSAIGKTHADFEADDLCLKFIEQYISSEHALKKVQLELAAQTLKEINAEKKQLLDGLSKAHGMQ